MSNFERADVEDLNNALFTVD